MNCDYHTNTKATFLCPKCKKPICTQCHSLFKSHLCIDCEKDAAFNKISKSILMFVISIALGVAAYFVFTKIKSNGSFIYAATLGVIYEAFDDIIKFMQDVVAEHDLPFLFINNEEFCLGLKIYCLACLPWGYYALSKVGRIDGDLIVMLVLFVLKLLVSAVIGPFIMPVVLIVSLVSFAKNIMLIRHCEKYEKEIIVDEALRTQNGN